MRKEQAVTGIKGHFLGHAVLLFMGFYLIIFYGVVQQLANRDRCSVKRRNKEKNIAAGEQPR